MREGLFTVSHRKAPETFSPALNSLHLLTGRAKVQSTKPVEIVWFRSMQAVDFDDRGSLPSWNGDRTFANEAMRSEDQPRLLAALIQ
jgi:hypothetical protein